MTTDFFHALLLSAAFLILFTAAEILYRVFRIHAEITRKIVHVGTGILTLLFPLLLSSHWWVLLLCASFFFILLASLRWKFLPSINAIDRKSYGSLLYPVIVYIVFLLSQSLNFHSGAVDLLYFYLPILTMAIADPIAALTGKRWPFGVYRLTKDKKSMTGTTAFAVVSLILTLSFFALVRGSSFSVPLLLTAIVVAAFSSLAEAASPKGFDNFSIPLVVLALIYTGDRLWL